MGSLINFNIAKKKVEWKIRSQLVTQKETQKRQDRILKALIIKSKRAKKPHADKSSIDNYKLVYTQDKNER